MAEAAGLPKDFDPEKHSRRNLLQGTDPKNLKPGVNVLHRDDEAGSYVLAQVGGSGETRAVRTRCWHCYRRPDGSYDCFEINCPWN